MKNNIIFVGYRGTGKSALGKRISNLLNIPFLDTDKMIVAQAGKSVPEIFSSVGESGFRDLESQSLAKALSQENIVLATGGGIVIDPANRALLRDAGFVVWLRASEEVIYQRINKDSNRPALTNLTPLEEISTLLLQRNPWYNEVAKYELDTSSTPFEQSAKRIVAAWEQFVFNK